MSWRQMFSILEYDPVDTARQIISCSSAPGPCRHHHPELSRRLSEECHLRRAFIVSTRVGLRNLKMRLHLRLLRGYSQVRAAHCANMDWPVNLVARRWHSSSKPPPCRLMMPTCSCLPIRGKGFVMPVSKVPISSQLPCLRNVRLCDVSYRGRHLRRAP